MLRLVSSHPFAVMIFSLVPLLCFSYFRGASAGDSLEVDTTSGLVRGFTNKTHPNVAQFLNIPFAEKPIGERRWLPPAKKTRENATIDATKFPLACSQWDVDPKIAPSIYNTDVTELLIQPPTYQGEDCLGLSVWAPMQGGYEENGSKKLPVIVWLYGGGFVQGGVNVPYQNAAPWVNRSKKHIVVAINYRVGLFGFPNAQGLSQQEQNLGLLDQRLGVEWVHDNIAKFGGDTSRIALMGQSAGAFSADYYNFAYAEDPIVSAFMLQSGSAHVPFGNPDVAQTNFTFLAKEFKCDSGDAKAQVECMRKISADDLNKFQRDRANQGTQPGFFFTPIVDERTVFTDEEYTARIASGKFSRKPAIMGTTRNEGAAIVPYNVTNPPTQEEIDQATALFMPCPGRGPLERFKANVTTFRYLYSGNFSNISPRPWFGAYHSAELPLLFGTYDIARGKGTELEKKVSEKMQDLWVAFVADPVNGLPKMGWKKYQGGSGEAVNFGANGTVIQPIAEKTIDGSC